MSISLNKFISDTGYCSRREADALIKAGRVLLNNKVAQTGNRFVAGDQVEVDGSLVTTAQKEKPVYILLNKPMGITTTTEKSDRTNIISFIDYPKRIFPVGRLDKDSEGLILLTNDGDIVNKMLRSGNAHEKEYHVRVNKPVSPGFAEKMAAGGIPVQDTLTLPCKVQVTGRQSFTIVLTQGLNRQIRKMCEYLGYAVVSLQRVRIMHLKLDKLASGKWRYLSEAELHQLTAAIKGSSSTSRKYEKSVKARASTVTNSVAGAITRKSKPVAVKPAGSAKPPKAAGGKEAAKPDPAAGKKMGKYKAFKLKGRQR